MIAEYLAGAGVGVMIAALAFVVRADWRHAALCGSISALLFLHALIAYTAGRRRRRP